MAGTSRSTADLIVECLENEDVTHVFGIPGEEDIRVVEAISRSSVRYMLTRHEQGASFMAETCGRLTGRAAALPRAAGTALTGVGESGRRRADRWPS
jgi:acetolactate synthase-1/2/3 large subunit